MVKGVKFKTSTKDMDLGYREIERQIKIIREKNPYVEIGILEKAGKHKALKNGEEVDGKATVADIATVHEYGSEKRNIPERSFLRATIDDNFSDINEVTNKLVDKITEGHYDVKHALDVVGLYIQTAIKRRIQSNIAPPLSPETVLRKNHAQVKEAKGKIDKIVGKPERSKGDMSKLNKLVTQTETGGNSTALIDTGQMLNSIQFQSVLDKESFGVGETEVEHDD